MIPERYAPQTYALMRIVFGFQFLCHGLQKFGMFGGEAAALFSWPRGVAGPLEVIFGICILIGLLTRPIAFLASGEMAVAYFLAHQPRGPLPILNGGEAAVLFCFAFLYMAARGAGIWSVDAARGGTRV
jgi:putative oxidoreductase